MTDERRDDEIIGRALSRAIETIDVNQTPFERSRIATAPARRSIFGVWQMAGGVAAIVLALAIGSWLTRPTEAQPGVAASPTAPASPIRSVEPTASPVQAPSAPIWVYFARDGLPPVGAYVDAHASSAVLASPEGRISSRISALFALASGSIPAGATNPMSVIAKPAPTAGTSQGSMGIFVSIQGDLAKVEFDLSPGWGVRGSAQSLALVQQLVYTITEEPGIRRALITEKGKPNATVDQIVIDRPLTREDVFGYGYPATQSIEQVGDSVVADIVDWRASVDQVAPGLGRFVVELKPTNTTEPYRIPNLTAKLEQVNDPNQPHKWMIRLELPDAVWQQAQGEAFHCCPLKVVGKTPIRQVAAYPLGANPTPQPGPGTLGGGAYRGVGFGIQLDDARPWRVLVLYDPLRIVVDVGGVPQATSDRVAVYQPRPGATVTRDLQLTGAARTFEANVNWQLLDSTGREVARGAFTGGSSGPLWGAFDTRIAVPTSVSGNVTLEVFEASAKDGSPQGVTQIPLTVR
jgi:hypothetical protein